MMRQFLVLPSRVLKHVDLATHGRRLMESLTSYYLYRLHALTDSSYRFLFSAYRSALNAIWEYMRTFSGIFFREAAALLLEGRLCYSLFTIEMVRNVSVIALSKEIQ